MKNNHTHSSQEKINGESPQKNLVFDLFSILRNSHSPELINVADDRYFMFLLGTDTNFTPFSVIPGYDRGETYSILAQKVVEYLKETGNTTQFTNKRPRSKISFSSPSVKVLNGPKTLGEDVGKNISQGVLLALQAAAAGKKQLFISGHSRGAVQSKLIIEELQRIKESLKTNDPTQKTFKEIICDSPCGRTKNALENLFEFFSSKSCQFNEEDQRKLRQNLEHLELSLFALDPVPGGGVKGLGKWTDSRYYEEIPEIRNELIILEDERSCFFKPAIFRGARPTFLRGHHGTASGNLNSQQNQSLAQLKPALGHLKTHHVQNITLLKCLHFFHLSPQQTSQSLSTKIHPELNSLINQFLQADKPERLNMIVNQYKEIHKNREAYQVFTQTSYFQTSVTSGIEHMKEARIVHNGEDNNVSLRDITPEMKGDYVNLEDVMMRVQLALNIDDIEDNELETLVNRCVSLLNTRFPSSSDSPDEDLTSSQREACSHLEDDEFKNTMIIFISAISGKYLRNHLTSEQKKKLLTTITDTLNNLDGSKENQTLAHELSKHIQSSIQETVQHQISAFVQEIKAQVEQVEAVLDKNKYKQQFRSFIKAMETRPRLQDMESVKKLQTLLEYKNFSIKAIQNATFEVINLLVNEEQTEAEFLNHEFISYYHAHLTSLQQYIEKTEKAIKQIDAHSLSADNLFNLSKPSKDAEKIATSVKEVLGTLQRELVSQKNVLMLLADNNDSIQSLQSALQDSLVSLEAMDEKNKELKTNVTQLEKNQNDLQHNLEHKNKELLTAQGKITNLTTENARLAQENSILDAQRTELRDRLNTQDEVLSQMTQESKGLLNEKTQLERDLNDSNQQKQTLQNECRDIRINLEQRVEEQSDLEERFNQLNNNLNSERENSCVLQQRIADLENQAAQMQTVTDELHLQLEKNAHQLQVTQDFAKALARPDEAKKLVLVEETLIPAAIKYKSHLANQLTKGGCKQKTLLNEKYLIVQAILIELRNKGKLPSDRVNQVKSILDNQHNRKLADPRNKADFNFRRLFTYACGGWALAKLTGHSHNFFYRTKGAAFVEECERKIKKVGNASAGTN